MNISDAIETYRDNPFVKCLSGDDVIQVNSMKIHEEKQEGYDEPWIWAYSLTETESVILLYAGSNVKAEIVKMEMV